eukprot:287370-Prymnesium_polylepis.1
MRCVRGEGWGRERGLRGERGEGRSYLCASGCAGWARGVVGVSLRVRVSEVRVDSAGESRFGWG